MASSTNSHTNHDVNIDFVTTQQTTMYEQEITTLERRVAELENILARIAILGPTMEADQNTQRLREIWQIANEAIESEAG